MSDSNVESVAPFGAPAPKGTAVAAVVSHLAPVPMFNPMLNAARDMVQGVNAFRAEIARADELCTNMEKLAQELTESSIMPNVAKHMEASVQRFRSQVTKVSDFCVRMEGVTADLHGGMDEDFKLPKSFQQARG